MPQDRPEAHAAVAVDLRPTFQPVRGGATLGVAAVF
jgi:hypothetical protein